MKCAVFHYQWPWPPDSQAGPPTSSIGNLIIEKGAILYNKAPAIRPASFPQFYEANRAKRPTDIERYAVQPCCSTYLLLQ